MKEKYYERKNAMKDYTNNHLIYKYNPLSEAVT